MTANDQYQPASSRATATLATVCRLRRSLNTTHRWCNRRLPASPRAGPRATRAPTGHASSYPRRTGRGGATRPRPTAAGRGRFRSWSPAPVPGTRPRSGAVSAGHWTQSNQTEPASGHSLIPSDSAMSAALYPGRFIAGTRFITLLSLMYRNSTEGVLSLPKIGGGRHA